jgi:transposase-like protein
MRPLEALIIGGYVRGLSDRDIESLMEEAGLGQVSKSTASRICRELRARYKTFCARSLADVELLTLFRFRHRTYWSWTTAGCGFGPGFSQRSPS